MKVWIHPHPNYHLLLFVNLLVSMIQLLGFDHIYCVFAFYNITFCPYLSISFLLYFFSFGIIQLLILKLNVTSYIGSSLIFKLFLVLLYIKVYISIWVLSYLHPPSFYVIQFEVFSHFYFIFSFDLLVTWKCLHYSVSEFSKLRFKLISNFTCVRQYFLYDTKYLKFVGSWLFGLIMWTFLINIKRKTFYCLFK